MRFKNIISLLCAGALYSSLQATVYEDGEDGLINGWIVNNGGVVTNIDDADLNSKVISLQNGGYTLGDLVQSANSWNNIHDKNLQMKMKFSSYFTMYVGVTTQNGDRLFVYTPRDGNMGVRADGTTIEYGLGLEKSSGNWVDMIRDLNKDLHIYEPDNEIVTVHGLKFLGNGIVDNIELKAKARHVDNVYEDAEDGDTFGWQVYDKSPLGATITNVIDAEKNSHVIELSGGGMENGYIVGNWDGKANAWAELDRKTLTWDMKFSEAYAFYITVQTTEGQRYLYYDTNSQDRGIIQNTYGTYIHHAFGGFSDGKWHTVTVDLERDLKAYEPNNHIVKVTGFLIRGSGRIDNIRFSDGLPKLAPTLYEDFESGNLDKWVVDHDGGREGYPPKMQIALAFDGSKYSGLFYPTYRGSQNTYKLDAMQSMQQFVLEADMTVNANSMLSHGMLGLRIETVLGPRLIYWDAYRNQRHIDRNNGTKPSITYYGNFAIIANGNPAEPAGPVAGLTYVHVKVDIDEYLQRFEPNNHVTRVLYYLQGDGNLMDNLTLSSQ